MDYFELAKEICYPNRFQRFFEIKDVEKSIVFDEVDSLKVKNGVLYNDDEELDYKDEHESGVDWSSRNEDEDR